MKILLGFLPFIAFAFLVMVIAEAAMVIQHGLPKAVGTAVIAAALLSAAWFTKRQTEEA